ncbi:ABC transporter permease subunit [Paenibacillus harenae]|uniref:ABC transporter permease subunit n=1 Tax=Paenibacillus harenae TaxID=306543 RepID=UPI0003F73999|nr:ABC transporter permease subunit [Paenibacillus harenae]
MNKALFASTMLRTYKLFSIFTALILFYLIVIISMFSSSAESDPFEMLPEAMRDAFGMGEGMSGLTGFIATGFYGVTFVLFMIILCIIAANQLMASLVDRGSMAYLLATPVSRSKVAVTQASVLIAGLFGLVLVSTLAGIAAVPVLIENADFNRSAFIQINIMGFLLFFVISGYAFLFSSLFNDAKQSLVASGGLSAAFYLFQMLSNMSENLEWLDYLTVLTLFQPTEIAAGEADIWPNAIGLGLAGSLLYALAVYIFKRRDLPL